MSKMELSSNDNPSYERTPFGKEMLKHFAFEPGYRNLNHGSYGTFPNVLRDKANKLRDECELRPCPFIKFKYPKYLDESRAAVAKFLNAPVSTVVFVANATTGVNTVLRNIVWNPDGKDEILQFNIIYPACGLTTEYISESTAINGQRIVNAREISLTFPLSHSDIIAAFKSAIQASRDAGRRPRMAVFDTVVSVPGIRLPFESLTEICRSEKILSLIDGAHGIGHVHLDLATLDPDFFVSNCHKWLFVPRSCAVLYVPERNQHLMRSTLPTSHGFVPKSAPPSPYHAEGEKSSYVQSFEFVGTMDNTPYLLGADAIKWREEVCGGEEKIMTYCRDLGREGGQKVAEILGTEVLDNKERTLTDCCMVNIRLPISIGEDKVVKPGDIWQAWQWMLHTLIDEYKTYMQIYPFQDKLWVRISAQVYLEIEDFEWAGKTLKEVCGRVENGEFRGAKN
ncbi:hypothetical protein FQN54_002504 [Arachnomyces sp. PD_36]|nr:hypothetical protein FQN54_002504 [Arachnomyces sp. PD_36]